MYVHLGGSSVGKLLGPVLLVVVGFEVLTAAVMNNSIFWDIPSRSSLKINRRFGGTCRLYLQGRKISHVRNQHEASC
jgi:hypothetical protein